MSKKRKKVVEEKVKKRRNTILRTYFINIFLGLVIFLIAAFLIIMFFFETKKVSYSGNTILSEQQLSAYLFDDKYCVNTVYCWGKNILFPKKDIPFVESVDITLTNPNSLKVTVKEKEFFGRMTDVDGNTVYFDENGVMNEISEVKLENVLEVTMEDVELKKLTVGDNLPVKPKRKKELLGLISDLNEQSLTVSGVHFFSDGSITVDYNQILINLGTSANLDAKVLRLKYILPQIADQAGTLHLEDWSEGNRDIVFEKAQ